MKKTVCGLLVCMMLAGCGGSAADSAVEVNSAYQSKDTVSGGYGVFGDAYDTEQGSGNTQNFVVNNEEDKDLFSKRIYTANVEVETTEFVRSQESLAERVKECGGFMESSDANKYLYPNEQGWTSSDDEYRITADYVIRIPAKNFDEFMGGMDDLGNVIRNSKSSENITAAYMKKQDDLDYLDIKKERLQELLKQADNMQDILEIENQIQDVEWQQRNASADLAKMDLDVDMSTINLRLREVVFYTVDSQSWGSRIKKAFERTWYSFAGVMTNFIVIFVYLLPYLLVLAAAASIYLFLKAKYGIRWNVYRDARRKDIALKKAKEHLVRTQQLKDRKNQKKDSSGN